MHMILFLVILLSITKLNAEPNNRGIVQPHIHEQNQHLCEAEIQKIIESMPKTANSKTRALLLSQKIDTLGKDLLHRGLNLNAYSYITYGNEKNLQFAMIPLWEGKKVSPEMPLTLFLYVWPSEQAVKHKSEGYHASNIHSHPISCALTVLKGTLCQENYRSVKGWSLNVAQKISEDTLAAGMMTFDNNESSFIHRLVCRDTNKEPCYTLHAYGASSADAVQDIFEKTFSQCSYHYILDDDGKLILQEW